MVPEDPHPKGTLSPPVPAGSPNTPPPETWGRPPPRLASGAPPSVDVTPTSLVRPLTPSSATGTRPSAPSMLVSSLPRGPCHALGLAYQRLLFHRPDPPDCGQLWTGLWTETQRTLLEPHLRACTLRDGQRTLALLSAWATDGITRLWKHHHDQATEAAPLLPPGTPPANPPPGPPHSDADDELHFPRSPLGMGPAHTLCPHRGMRPLVPPPEPPDRRRNPHPASRSGAPRNLSRSMFRPHGLPQCPSTPCPALRLAVLPGLAHWRRTTDDPGHQPPCPGGRHLSKTGACISAQRGGSLLVPLCVVFCHSVILLHALRTVTLKLRFFQKKIREKLVEYKDETDGQIHGNS